MPTQSGTVNVVVALADEARPLVDHLSLRSEANHQPFRVYNGAGMRLIVCGVGKLAAAAAVGYLYRYGNNSGNEAWLNVGIAGHATLPQGAIRLVHKVIDESSGNCWFPSRIVSSDCDSCEIRCVDRPEEEYVGNTLVDMESAGFTGATSRLAKTELVQLLKIVSDNRQSPASQLSRGFVRGLISQHMGVVERTVALLRDLSSDQIGRSAPGTELESFRARWHFTATQTSQLRELLRRWQALRPDELAIGTVGDRPTSRSALEALRLTLDQTAVRIAPK